MNREETPRVEVGRGTLATAGARQDSLRVLWLQFAAVIVVVVALWSYLAFATLSESERAVLAPGFLWARTVEHVGLVAAAAVIVLVLALPLGLALARGPLRRLVRPVLAVVGIGEGAPAIGVMVLLACALGFGARSAVAGLVAWAVLPVLRIVVVGLRDVDAREAEIHPAAGARPQAPEDASSLSTAFRVPTGTERPAGPVLSTVLVAVRAALVLLVGAASLAAFTGGGGLGVLITTGVEHHQTAVTVVGATLVTLLAVVTDWLGRYADVLVRRRRPGTDI